MPKKKIDKFQMSEKDYFDLCEIIQSLSVSQFVINEPYNEPTACQQSYSGEIFQIFQCFKERCEVKQ